MPNFIVQLFSKVCDNNAYSIIIKVELVKGTNFNKCIVETWYYIKSAGEYFILNPCIFF
jgi:hypothetical protein